jgi:hypothetical protein
MSKSLIIFATAFLLSSCAFPLPSAGPGFILTDTTEGIAMNNNVAMSKKVRHVKQISLGSLPLEMLRFKKLSKRVISNKLLASIEHFSAY